MKILLDYNKTELQQVLAEYNFPSFVAGQVYSWINKGCDFVEMSNISKVAREKLSVEFVSVACRIEKTYTSAIDGTIKLLYRLHDGNLIEGVLMNYKYGNTLCVSTQVGCRMGCKFCASTLGGLVRNLSAGEILGQVVAVNRYLGGDLENRKITNIVLMGSGEPLDNFDNVIKFLYLVNDVSGLNISMRNISLSTCGIASKIDELAKLNLQINLTISLHSADQVKREEIMPIARAYSLETLMISVRNYFEATKRRVIFEYTLIDDANDSYSDALKLANLTRNISAHINLIRLNPVKETKMRGTSDIKAKKFLEYLTNLNVSATLRRQMGVDIEGACGQLRQRYIEEDKA